MADVAVHVNDQEVGVRWDDGGPVYVLDTEGRVREQHRPPRDSVEFESYGGSEERDRAAYEAAVMQMHTALRREGAKRRLSKRTIDALCEAVR